MVDQIDKGDGIIISFGFGVGPYALRRLCHAPWT